MEKGSFREHFNRKWKKAINRSCTSESFLARKGAIKNVKNVRETIFYFKSQYLTHNEEQRSLIQDIPNQEEISSFQAIIDYL